MKHVHVLVKVSLILILALGFLRLEAHAVSAQDTNPPPAGETTDGSSSAPDGSSGANTGGANTGGANTGGGDTGGATDTGGGDNAGGDSTGDSPASSTSADDDASNPAGDSNSAGDDASGSATAPDDEASDSADSSTSTDDAASSAADDSTSVSEDASSAAPEAAGAEDSSSPDAENAEGLSEEGASNEGASDEGVSDEGVSDESASQEAAEIIEEAAEKDITLADGDGQPIVAADTQAQELLTSSSSDPWFVADDGTVVGYSSGGGCAAGVGECHANEPNSIQAALNDARSAGKQINIEEGDYSAEEFTLDDDTRSFNLAGNVSVKTINLNTAYNFVTKVFGGAFSALEVWLNFGGPKTATLQDGVNLTESGGTLNVASKTYNENVTIDATKNGIHIAGSGNPTVGPGLTGPAGFEVHADDVTISGFTIQNAGIGILTDKDIKVNVDNNRFYGNAMGVVLDDGSSGIFSNNSFGEAGDPTKMNMIGILASSSGSIPPSGYTITSSGDKFANFTVGMQLMDGISAKITGDVFSDFFAGIMAFGGSLDIADSKFQGSMTGIDLTDGSLTSQGNLYSWNSIGLNSMNSVVNSDADIFQSNFEGGIDASSGSLNVAGGTFQDNGYGINLHDSSTLTSQGNLYEGNTTGLASAASSVDSDGDTFRANTEDGIYAQGSALNVAGSTFKDNGDGIHLEDASTLTSQGNLYEGNTRGIYSSASTLNSDGDRFINYLEHSGLDSGAFLENDSQAVITNGTFGGNSDGIVVYKSNLSASNNQFTSNTHGIFIGGSSQVSTSNNIFGEVGGGRMNFTGIYADGNEGLNPGAIMLTSTGDNFFGRHFGGDVSGVTLFSGVTGRFANDIFSGPDCGLAAYNSDVYAVNSTFSNNTAGAFLYHSKARFENDTFQYNQYGINTLNASDVFVTGSTFTTNIISGASLHGTSSLASLGNTYRGNSTGLEIDATSSAISVFDNYEANGFAISSNNPARTQAHFDRFYNNGIAINNTDAEAEYLDAGDNWWGDNQGAAGKTAGNVDFSEWLAFDMSASDDPIYTGGETSQLTTQMVKTDGAAKVPLSALELAGIQGAWFNYTPIVNLQTPGMGTVAGDTFTSAQQAGQAHFTGTQFDDETPAAQVTILQSEVPDLPGNPPMPVNPGSPAPAGLAPALQTVIPVTGAGLLDLACGGASQLTLANGNSVLIPALEPCGMQASLQPAAQDALPGPLPEGVTFVDGLTLSLVDNGGNTLDILPQESTMQVSFAGAPAQASANLTVYWWDGSAWQEVPDSSLGVAASNHTGLFVLVTK